MTFHASLCGLKLGHCLPISAINARLLHRSQSLHTSVALAQKSAMLQTTSSAPKRVLLYQYPELLQGILHKRYKRFLADLEFPEVNSTAVLTEAAVALPSQIAAATVSATAAVEAVQMTTPSKRRRRSAAATTAHTRGEVSSTATVGVDAIPNNATAEGESAVTVQQQATALTVVHCPNTGSMSGLLDSLPTPAACSISASATRKYRHTLEMIHLQGPAGSTWVGVHSALANKLAAVLLKQQLLPQLGQYSVVQSEVKLGGGSSTRFDFMLTRPDGRKVYVEVKSVTMAMTQEEFRSCSSRSSSSTSMSASSSTGGRNRKRPAGAAKITTNTQQAGTAPGVLHDAAAESVPVVQSIEKAADGLAAAALPADTTLVAVFPDAVSDRAQRHVQDLTELKAAGHDAVCLFIIQRHDCGCFVPAAHIDPAYAAAVKAAHVAGVQMLAVVCELEPACGSTWFKGCVPVVLQ